MNASVLAASIPGVRSAPLPGPAAVAADRFEAHLRAADEATGDEARRVAEQLVALTFVQPVLALARESSMAEGPFAPSAAERRFAPLLDQELADRIVRRSGFPLVEEIAARLGATPRPGEVTDVRA